MGNAGAAKTIAQMRSRATRSSTGAAAAKPAKAAKETIHTRAARLRGEQGLPAEVQPQAGKAYNQHLEQVGASHDVSHIDAYGAPRVQALREQYGEHQLGAALNRLNNDKLAQTVTQYNQETGAGIKTGSRAQMLSAVVAHATQGRYTADFKASTAANKASAKEAATAARTQRAQATAAKAATAKAPSAPKAPKAPMTREQHDANVARLTAKASRLAIASDQERAAAAANGTEALDRYTSYGGPALRAWRQASRAAAQAARARAPQL